MLQSVPWQVDFVNQWHSIAETTAKFSLFRLPEQVPNRQKKLPVQDMLPNRKNTTAKCRNP